MKKILNESAEINNSLKTIAEIGDSCYFETRAIELITEAKQLYVTSNDQTDYQSKLRQAISLLAMARLAVEEEKLIIEHLDESAKSQ